MSMTELLTMIGIENVTKAVTALLIFISVCAILTSLVTEGLKCVEKLTVYQPSLCATSWQSHLLHQ